MSDEHATSNYGVVLSIRGSVVDAQFSGLLPSVFSILRCGRKEATVIEVMEQIDPHRVRGIALTATQGLARGMTVRDTGKPLQAPVGKTIISRMFDVFGHAIDRQPEPTDTDWRSVHRLHLPCRSV
jgi:F-type H+-transporting ATPase subunit beta